MKLITAIVRPEKLEAVREGLESYGVQGLTVSAASVGNSPVLTYVNDYGGRPQLSFNCAGSTCTVVPEKKGE